MRPDADVDLDLILSHFEHIIDLVGDEHVSFGTDFDGAGIPDVVKDAAGLPVVLREMKRRGWSDGRMERVCNGNFLRVMRAAWRD
jgi:membrane dipeptidase